MTGSSILPVTIKNKKLYFLFGKEHNSDDSPGFSDFGGGVENGEDIFETAMREGGEELTGFLGDATEIKDKITEAGGFYKIVYNFPDNPNNSYHIHIFNIDYDENLPKYYNTNHKFLWNNMNSDTLKKTKLFEKTIIEWFSIEDIKTRKCEFRKFYQNIIDRIIFEEKTIYKFVKSRKSKRNKTKKIKRKKNKTITKRS